MQLFEAREFLVEPRRREAPKAPREYIITTTPEPGVYSVWEDRNPIEREAYTVVMGRRCSCTCPHWIHRLEKGQRCKHHDLVIRQGAWDEADNPWKDWDRPRTRVNHVLVKGGRRGKK